MKITASCADNLYRATLNQIRSGGDIVSPRNDATMEVIGAHLVLTNPYRNLITIPERKLNYHFMVAEWLWIMSGSNELAMITPYNKVVEQFSDDGVVLKGAYGPKIVEQLPYIYEKLREDPYSRQAVLTIWRERPRESRDVPCTVAMQFFIRDRLKRNEMSTTKVLDMIVYMRSNDAWWGLPYDLFTFTMIQQQVASALGVELGEYHHMVGSLHIYDRHAAVIAGVIGAPDTGISDFVTMSALPTMPPEFKAMYSGLTLMHHHAEAKEDLVAWMGNVSDLIFPWGDLLGVLGHRFHKDRTLLAWPWNQLVR